MILLTLLSRQHAERKTKPIPSAPRSGDMADFARKLIVLMLAGYLLFAHGCHGDEDNELLARAAEVLTLSLHW